MVPLRIMLGLVISRNEIEVVKEKANINRNLPTLKSIKDIKSFLTHDGYYRRFIQDFVNVVRPLCELLDKDKEFFWIQKFLRSLPEVKKKCLTSTMIVRPSYRTFPFELMCDASH